MWPELVSDISSDMIIFHKSTYSEFFNDIDVDSMVHFIEFILLCSSLRVKYYIRKNLMIYAGL